VGEQFRRLTLWLDNKTPWWREALKASAVWLWLLLVVVGPVVAGMVWLAPSSPSSAPPAEQPTFRFCKQDPTLPDCSAAGQENRWVTVPGSPPRKPVKVIEAQPVDAPAPAEKTIGTRVLDRIAASIAASIGGGTIGYVIGWTLIIIGGGIIGWIIGGGIIGCFPKAFGDWFWRQRPWVRVTIGMSFALMETVPVLVGITGLVLIVLVWTGVLTQPVWR
jgi:hypothetical protein